MNKLNLFKLIALWLVLGCSVSAHADSFYRLVGYDCDQKSDRLVISYKGAYNEAGQSMLEEKLSTEWAPESLIASMKDDDHIGELKIIKATCKLKHFTYQLRIGPTPGNFNIQGKCGAVVTAWVEVLKGGKVVLPRYELEGACHTSEVPVTTEIVFFPRLAKPRFKKVSQEDFIK